MAQSGIKAGSESDEQELDCDEITLKGEDIYNKVNSVLASIQLGKFFLVIFTAIVSHHTKFDFKIIAKKYRKNLDDRLALNYFK